MHHTFNPGVALEYDRQLLAIGYIAVSDFDVRSEKAHYLRVRTSVEANHLLSVPEQAPHDVRSEHHLQAQGRLRVDQSGGAARRDKPGDDHVRGPDVPTADA